MRWPFPRNPRLDWVQVEITSECSARCRYCPRHYYAERWIERRLPVAAFEALLPQLSRVGHLHLQGWGEPLLHPGFITMVRMAKEAGLRVGTTTNAMHLTEELAGELVDSGIDIVAISLAGTDGASDCIRRGTRIDQVRRACRALRTHREKRGAEHPRLHLAYLMLRSRLDDLESLPGLLGELRVDEAVLSSISLVLDPAMEAEACLVDDEAGYRALESRLQAARDEAARRGCALHFHLAFPHRGPGACAEKVGRSCVVTSSGEIVPCVFSALPLDEPGEHIFAGRRHPLPGLAFGDVERGGLRQAWNSRGYRAFRRAMSRGEDAPECVPCMKRHVHSLAHASEAEAEPEAVFTA